MAVALSHNMIAQAPLVRHTCIASSGGLRMRYSLRGRRCVRAERGFGAAKRFQEKK